MDRTLLKSTLELQLKRLARHHEDVIQSYDLVSLLDFSHTLRIFADLKNDLTPITSKFNTRRHFFSNTPTKKVMRSVKGSVYVFSYLHRGAVTYANKGEIMTAPKLSIQNHYSGNAQLRLKDDGAMEFFKLGISSRPLEERQIENFDNVRASQHNYLQWLGSELVRLAYFNESGVYEVLTISRENLIRRVANAYNASHPLGDKETFENRFDPPIKWLMKFSWGGLPLPYLLLISISQDILDIFPPILDGQS